MGLARGAGKQWGQPMQPTIILLSPPGIYYAYVLDGLARAFKAFGYPCAWRNSRLDFESLIPMLKQFGVTACLEINRVLPRDVPWPRDVAHLAWIQDYRYDELDLTDGLGASHHMYFFMDPSAFGIHLDDGRSWSILLPGARGDVPVRERVEMRRDFCFAGYIPAPLDDDLPVSCMPDGKPVNLATFLEFLPPDTLRQSCISLTKIRARIEEACRKIGCLPITDQYVVRILDEFLPRTIERKMILESIVGLGGSLDIFGPSTWQSWPQFAPFHRGNIENPVNLDPIFQSTKVNLHNSGMSMHHRVIDCLAAGGFLLVNETPRDFDVGGIRHYLEPECHYVSYAVDEVATVARDYLPDDEGRARIATQGRREILASHTWSHRAAQILRDLNLPVPPMSVVHLPHRVDSAPSKLQGALN
jgi:hypothetical protein